MNFCQDHWSPSGTQVARFDSDEERGALYLITPTAKILAMVLVYDVAEWGDVVADEVRVWWEQGPVAPRCVAEVRGRRRYIDVQEDPAVVRQEAA